MTALAIAMRCRCPPDSVTPRSPTIVSYPSGILLDEFVRVGELRRPDDVFAPGVGLPYAMFCQIGREQERVLEHEADLVRAAIAG